MGGFLLGPGVFWRVWAPDGQARSRQHFLVGCPVGRFHLRNRMARAGAVVPVLPADLYAAATQLDWLSGPSLFSADLPALRLGTLAIRSCTGNSGRTLCKVLGGGGAFGARSARHSCPGGKLWLDVADAQPRDGRRSALYPPYGDAS